MIEQATRDLGRVDILVNNAGIQHTSMIEEFSDERWDARATDMSSRFARVVSRKGGNDE